jgi:hypothetical protein
MAEATSAMPRFPVEICLAGCHRSSRQPAPQIRGAAQAMLELSAPPAVCDAGVAELSQEA